MGLPFICKNTICSDCKTLHLKDPSCGGDYTVEGKLMSYCPECGGMLPYLESFEPEELPSLSPKQRRVVGTKIAQIHQLDFREMYQTVKEINGDDFAESLQFRLRLIFDVIMTKEEIENLF